VPYLIDGHNLIATMPGISLSDVDDEQALIQVLARYASETRRSITVYFDRGSLLHPRETTYAGVKTHFVRPPRTADDALRAHIKRLGREAPNWTVVSSDGEVRQAAQQAGARVLDSQNFAARLSNPTESPSSAEKPEPSMRPEDIEAWEQLFQNPDPPDRGNSS
jgi:predicted RNA-binding protein with PIN domain